MSEADFWAGHRRGPVATYGKRVRQPKSEKIIYKGQPLPSLIASAGGDPFLLRRVLKDSRIGDPFSIPVGVEIVVESQPRSHFPTHREA